MRRWTKLLGTIGLLGMLLAGLVMGLRWWRPWT